MGRAVIAGTDEGEVVCGVLKDGQKHAFDVFGFVNTLDNLIKEDGGKKVIYVSVVVVEGLPMASALLTEGRDVDVIK